MASCRGVAWMATPGTSGRTLTPGQSEQVAERDALWYARLALRLCQIVYYGALIVVLIA